MLKKVLGISLILAAITLFAACAGPSGPAGPAGTERPRGQAGPSGSADLLLEQASPSPQRQSTPTQSLQESTTTLAAPSPSNQLTTPSVLTSSPVPSQEQIISQGKELYSTFGCAACHGPEGKGVIGPSLIGKSMEDIAQLVRKPRSPAMPPFSPERLPDTDLDKIAGFIISLNK